MASPKNLTFTEEDIKGLPTYDDFEPGWYTGELVEVRDIKANSGNTGWSWDFEVDGLQFSIATWHGGRGGWKTKEVLEGLHFEVKVGQVKVNPSSLIGRKARLLIDYDQRSKRPDLLTIMRVRPVEEAPMAGMDTLPFEENESGWPGLEDL